MNIYCIHVCENDSARVVFDKSDHFLEPGVEFSWPSCIPTLSCKGRFYDWIKGGICAIYVLEKVRIRLKGLSNVQWHGPFLVDGNKYFLMNVLCVPNITKDNSSYNQIFFNESVAVDYDIFRPKVNANYARKIFVSESFKKQTEAAGETGLRFGLIKSDGWEDFPF
jgi:hypothetical protein